MHDGLKTALKTLFAGYMQAVCKLHDNYMKVALISVCVCVTNGLSKPVAADQGRLPIVDAIVVFEPLFPVYV